MDRQPSIDIEAVPLCTLLDEVKRRGIVKLTVSGHGEMKFEYAQKVTNGQPL